MDSFHTRFDDKIINIFSISRFDGKLIDIEAAFKDHLNTFVPFLLSPSKIQVKKISGNEVKCKELVGFFKAYIDIFKVCMLYPCIHAPVWTLRRFKSGPSEGSYQAPIFAVVVLSSTCNEKIFYPMIDPSFIGM